MPIYQAYNKKSKSWVKYHFKKKKGFEVVDVKQKNSLVPFIGIPIKGKKR